MRWIIIVAALALSACQPTHTKFVGTWVHSDSGSEIAIGGKSCKFYAYSGVGWDCSVSSDVISIKRGSAFTEMDVIMIQDKLMVSMPGGGVRFYELANAGG